MVDVFLVVVDWIQEIIGELQQNQPRPHVAGEVLSQIEALMVEPSVESVAVVNPGEHSGNGSITKENSEETSIPDQETESNAHY